MCIATLLAGCSPLREVRIILKIIGASMRSTQIAVELTAAKQHRPGRLSRLTSAVSVVALASIAFFGTLPTVARAGDLENIAYRQNIMKTIDAQAAAIGQILSGEVPDDQAVAHFESIALAASTALKSFEVKSLGGESKPEVWSNWADYSKRMLDFAQKSAEVVKVGKTQGKEAALAMALDALPCKSCHEKYRDANAKK
jgi:cytochrome c556